MPTHQQRDDTHGSRLLECTQCGAVREAGEPCAHLRVSCRSGRRAPVSFLDGDLGLVDRSRRAHGDLDDPAVRARWHAMLAWIGDERGYKPGWVALKYKEKFGTFPPWGATPEPIPPTPEVRSWVRSRQIAFARSRVA